MELRHRLALALLTLPLAAALTACGGGAGSDQKTSGSSGSTASDVGGSSDAARTPQDARAADGVAAKPAVDRALQRAVIANGNVRLSTEDLAGVRQDAINLVTGLGGHLADEHSLSDTRGRLERVDLTVRVPADSFERALDGLAALGTVRHRQQTVEDVTTQVIDINARVKAQSDSVDSIERLLARANTIAEIMSVERELSTRQAELDSLVQQQKYLADQTSLSSIQVTLTRPPRHHESAPAPGFLGGLEGGWHALGQTLVVIGTAIGAVLPFAVVVALLGGPVVWLTRRRRLVAAPPPAPAPEP
ncbi:DUF4349 domain-containing protein [Nocardioides pocheonensis]|uniref:DUF4349 domain-containing protein n=1 Tax=Nocardioides pocheonensis TaxID=661485 RepID=A0A3N0GNW1_9ACTN|nr:DUF4349 domain-containing protein [Nocardioides pocheonensis]RNM14165.1 DUF4349 domain-containing protein [Nocardioides pocheonensis]